MKNQPSVVSEGPVTANGRFLLGDSQQSLKELPLSPNRLDGIVQFVLGRMEMLFSLGAMSGHIVVVGSAGTVHLFDCFIHVVVGRFEVVPIMNPVGNRDPGNKR
jgi:hypothetical protein